MVVAWIEQYQARNQGSVRADCRWCGYPHDPNSLCNGATFGQYRLCGHDYFVSLSNVVSSVEFMRNHVPVGAYHWRDGRFFKRTEQAIEVHFFEPYNGVPQRQVWFISRLEWETICQQMKAPNALLGPKMHVCKHGVRAPHECKDCANEVPDAIVKQWENENG